jgi:hypothetical protein
LAIQRSKSGAGEAFVGDYDVAGQGDAFEHLFGGLALWCVRWRELEADRHPVGGAAEVEPETPEEAAVRAAVAVAGVAGELRAADRLVRLSARHRRRVEQPEVVAEARAGERQIVERASDLRGKRPQPAVVARLVDQHREQMPEPVARERQELAIVRQPQEHLADRERDQLGVAQLRRAARTSPTFEEIIDLDIKCDSEGVEGGEHEASLVDVAITTPTSAPPPPPLA